MTREELYSSERLEREAFENCALADPQYVPVTRDGFEAMVERAASCHSLPVDDGLRSMAAGFIHHIPSDVCMIDLTELATSMLKVVSNNLTFAIDQEVKEKRQKEVQAEALKLVDAPDSGA